MTKWISTQLAGRILPWKKQQKQSSGITSKEKAVAVIWDYIYLNFENGIDSLSDYDWLNDYALSATAPDGKRIVISYDCDTNTVKVDNLST